MRIHRFIAGAAFAAAVAFSGASYAFETTSIGGTNPDGTAQFQDPDSQDLKNSFGGLEFGVIGKSSGDDVDTSARPPWELKPTPPSRSFYSSPMSGSSMFRPGN
jgi:hypothetical protein